MTDWQPIETAPKDGSTITVRREFCGSTIYEGPAAWRTVHFKGLDPDPLGRPEPAWVCRDEIATGWMHPAGVKDKRVPEPTHWKPL